MHFPNLISQNIPVSTFSRVVIKGNLISIVNIQNLGLGGIGGCMSKIQAPLSLTAQIDTGRLIDCEGPDMLYLEGGIHFQNPP